MSRWRFGEAPTSADDFAERGQLFTRAWNTMRDRCAVPPSLEVFDHELAVRRGQSPRANGIYDDNPNPGLTVEGMARRIAESYHRVPGIFPEG